jgi:hypothetical protein
MESSGSDDEDEDSEEEDNEGEESEFWAQNKVALQCILLNYIYYSYTIPNPVH